MIEVIVFILVLSVLILSHEWGHFVAAKLSKMKVLEFGLGFPPTLFRFKRGDTKYSVNLIPFGGFVKIHGEDEEKRETPETDPDFERRFSSRPKLLQAFVIVAGVLFNFLFAWLLFTVGFMSGFPTAVTDANESFIQDKEVVITSILPNSPAESATLLPGMRIVGLHGEEGDVIPWTIEEVSSFIEKEEGEFIIKTHIGDGNIKEITVTAQEGIIEGKKGIGITMDQIGTLSLPPHKAVIFGFTRTIELISLTAKGIAGLLRDAVTGNAGFESVSGPIGIYNLVGEAARFGFVYLLGFTAVISISLGVINLVPFPALDGGRLLFLIIEAIKGSPLKPIVTATVNYIGFVILIALMILISYGDLLKLGVFN
jgi:regulator of sigma E protease